MTPDDPEERRVADELARRERQGHKAGTAVDPATLRALFEAHEAVVEQIVARTEAAMAQRIDALAGAQGAAAETVRREIERGRTGGGGAEETAALVRRFGDEQSAAWKQLSAGLRDRLDALTCALDAREGAVFDRIDRVAETLKPGVEALEELRQTAAGTAAVACDVADIKEAAAGSRLALDEAATFRETVTENTRAMTDVAAMRPVLDAIAAGHGMRNAISRRWLWFGLTFFVTLALAFGTAGVALQRETAIWPPLPEAGNRERDAFWERHGEQVTHCIEVAQAYDRGMLCTIIDPDP